MKVVVRVVAPFFSVAKSCASKPIGKGGSLTAARPLNVTMLPGVEPAGLHNPNVAGSKLHMPLASRCSD